MQETSTRIVRTTFDYNNAPYANLVIGEVIGFPGKWSSYPPHFHPQPEIYYYKTYPTGGHAFAEVGDDVFKISGNDTVLIQSGMTHPHVTYPGYALWYLWAIRHWTEIRILHQPLYRNMNGLPNRMQNFGLTAIKRR